jgi:hypothetical protein
VSTSVVPPANDAQPTEVLELVHHHPGRLRVRAEVLQTDPDLPTRVSSALDAFAGIRQVTHNPRTGSVLVEYEPGLVEPDVIALRIAETARLISPFDPRAAKPVVRPAASVIEGTRTLNGIADELTGGRADLRALIPAALAGAAAYSFVFGRGPRLPRWDNLLWWSYSVFSSLHAREINHRERSNFVNQAAADGAASEGLNLG